MEMIAIISDERRLNRLQLVQASKCTGSRAREGAFC